MKLENYSSSRGGLRPSPIADLRHPEERMAARLIERIGASPPIDVEGLCRKLATLAFKEFPVEIDGLCLDLKTPGRRPKVWVSKNIPRVRKRFTLAHEISHIIIPWHAGTIVDELEAPRSTERTKYREMEAEANRFAAELLMPTSWVVGLAERSEHVAGLMHSISEIAEVSSPAAFLKTVRHGRPGFIGAAVRDGVVVRGVRTPETSSLPPERGMLLRNLSMPVAHDQMVVRGSDTDYHWWRIHETIDDPGVNLEDWRLVLNDILQEIPSEYRHKARASVNAMIGLGIGREPKGAPVNRIYKRGLEAAQNRGGATTWIKHIISHPRFSEYVLARARQRAAE